MPDRPRVGEQGDVGHDDREQPVDEHLGLSRVPVLASILRALRPVLALEHRVVLGHLLEDFFLEFLVAFVHERLDGLQVRFNHLFLIPFSARKLSRCLEVSKYCPAPSS